MINKQNNADTIIDEIIVKRKTFIKKHCREDSLVNNQFIFLNLFKVANYYFYCIMFGSDSISKELKSDKLLYLNGVNIFFDHLFCNFTEEMYAPTFLTENVGDIHSFIKFCGEVGELERIKDYLKYHLVEFKSQSENLLQLRYTNRYIDLEKFEILEEIKRAERILEKQGSQINDINQKKDIINEQMKELVHPWQQHFIGYDTNESVDIYFEEIAKLYAERTFYFESFAENAEFGRIPYKVYKQCAILIISYAFKHIEYSRLLTQKHTEIKFINVFTINRDIDRLIDTLCDTCDININEARQLLDCFTLTYEKYHFHRKNIDYLIMPFVQVSKTQVVFSVIGALSGIYAFLMAELNRKFPNDWSKNISTRESQFRNDLFKMFDDELYLKIDRNLIVTSNGRTCTDIDACIIEKTTKQIVFFQLKWQEQSGGSMGRRQSRKLNFLNETYKWIDDVTEWLKQSDNKKLTSMLGLKKQQIDVETVKLFVVGKHSVYFSGDYKYDDRAEWALWLQLQRLYNADHTTFRSIKSLIEKLKEDSPYTKLPKQKKMQIRIAELDIEVYPYKN